MLARGTCPRPGAHHLAMGGPASGLEPARFRGARPLPHRPHALYAGDHGCALAHASRAPHRGDEVGTGRLHGRRQQLDRLRHPSCAGADARRAADGRARQALLASAHRSAHRREPGSARARQASPRARCRQHGALEGIPGRTPRHHRREQRGGPALHAGPLSLPRRGRCLSALGRRGRRSGCPCRSEDAHVLLALQGPHRLDADHSRSIAHRARVRGFRPAALLRAVPALRGDAVA